MKKEVIDASNINKFWINAKERRNLKEPKVKELVALLKSGNHFNSPFVVNEVQDSEGDERWRLLDGNNREEAMLRVLNDDPSFRIVIWMAVYRNLNSAEEREVFTLWNKGSAQSATDFLKVHYETIPLGKELLRRLPVTIYGDKQHLPIKNLVGCQIDSKAYKRFSGSYSCSKEKTISDFQALTLQDITMVEDFCEFMRICFGPFSKTNRMFYQTTPLSSLYRIWFDNQNLNSEKLIKAFKKTFASQPGVWEGRAATGGRKAAKTFYEDALSQLNRHNSSIHFKNDDEAIELNEEAERQKQKVMTVINIVKRK